VTTTGRGLAVTSPKLLFTPDGTHCYAYSGAIDADNTGMVDQLKFTTYDDPINGQFTLGANMLTTDEETGGTTLFALYFNDVLIHLGKADGLSEDMPSVFLLPVLIPPSTDVLLQARCSNDVGSTTCNYIGSVI